MPGRPPSTEVTTATMTAPYSPIRGSSPATTAKAVDSGISAREVMNPAVTSRPSTRG
ncbi:Uncharacterised protein [Mycobacteroides abscessus subsp. abscessus]|nr:Uncharacterised protein [Mycobacteroides abscessus subsp. abscessus]